MLVVQPVKRPSFQNNLQSALLSVLIWHLNHYCYCCCLAISQYYKYNIHTCMHVYVYICIWRGGLISRQSNLSFSQSVGRSFVRSGVIHLPFQVLCTLMKYIRAATHTYRHRYMPAQQPLQQCRQQLQYIQILCSAISFKLQPERGRRSRAGSYSLISCLDVNCVVQ